MWEEKKRAAYRDVKIPVGTPLGIKRLDHHLNFSLLDHKQVSFFKHGTHRINNLVEATGSTTFLRETGNA